MPESLPFSPVPLPSRSPENNPEETGSHQARAHERRRPLWRRLLPSSLFGRALLIVLLPILLAQGTAAYLFYARHWDNISRNFAGSVAGEIAFFAEDFAEATPSRRTKLAALSLQYFGTRVAWLPGTTPPQLPPATALGDPLFDDVAHQLEERMPYAFRLQRVPGDTQVRVVVWLQEARPENRNDRGGQLSFLMSKKRLVSPTIEVWLIATGLVALLVLAVAVLFLRNQVRPIVQLARAADRFGRGQELPGFHPHGAREVRMAAHAFLTMKERLGRMLASRTEMLAAISHDLRTPLTRMQLQLALLPQEGETGEAARKMRVELGRMESMIAEYLDFVRGAGGEAAVRLPLGPFLREIVGEYVEAGQAVSYVEQTGEPNGEVTLSIRPRAFRRALANLIDNALRYGRCVVTLDASPSLISLHVEDDGPGIAPEHREEALLPFRRLDEARTPATGGAGLGLSIVREVAHAAGGKIALGESALGGLSASLLLPR